jgi:hypothetical protein
MMSGSTTEAPSAAREPLAGYNHNIHYHERIYHVQTEDSGLARPHILTHLFLDGMIIASLRTDYSELIAAPDNEAVVREIMQEQHKQIMKMLRRGELDQRIDELKDPDKAAVELAAEPAAELPPEFGPAAPAEPRVVTVPDTTTEQRRCVTLVDFPPVLDAQLQAAIAKQQEQQEQQEQQQQEQQQEQQQQQQQQVQTDAEPEGDALHRTPSGIDLPDSPPESIELEPLAEAAQMADPIQAADPSAADALVFTPPPERVVNRKEARSIRRGQAISREIRIPTEFLQEKKLEVGQRIDLDHPAFSAFPMLEWEGANDDALELDLEAINSLDLEAEPRRLDSQQLQAIELELEMPPEPLPAPRTAAALEAAGTALAGDPMAAKSLAVEPRRSSSPSWGEELELGELEDFEMMVTPSGPIPIPRLPTPHSPGEMLSPLPALNEERQGSKPSLPPVQSTQRPLEVKPMAPPPLKRASSPAPEQFDDPPPPPPKTSPTPTPASSMKPPPAVSPRIMKRPSLPVIPLDKLVEIEPELMGKKRSDPTVGEKPSTLDKPSGSPEDESDDNT